MIDWQAFLVVALASLIGAGLVVLLYALGLRNLTKRAWVARLCFALCAAAVLFGVYLIVPALHGIAG